MSILPPVRPLGGEIYVFAPEKAQDYIADCYVWSRNTGWNKFPRKNPIVERKKKKIVTPEEPINGDGRFALYLHRHTSERSPLLVHYVGDQSLFQIRPHGNEIKHPTKDFFSTVPSTRMAIKSCENQPAQFVYETMKSKPDARMHPAFPPRNLKQVQNLQYVKRLENRVSHDALYEVYLLGFEFPGFIREYRASFEFENNLVFLTSLPLLEKADFLLCRPKNIRGKMMEFYYDTTFKIGDLYLSMLSFRQYMLNNEPIIPCALFLHQRRFMDDHLSFLNIVKEACPNLAKQEFAFITDHEFKDVSSVFPKARHFFCWKHFADDVRWWLNKHSGLEYQRKNSSTTYMNDIHRLMRATTIEDYETMLAECKLLWADPFTKYFEKSLDKDLREKVCTFVIAESGLLVADHWLGITTNAAESLNAVLKREIKSSKVQHQNFYGEIKVTMAEAILTCYNMSKYYDYEIATGMCGVGKYPITREWRGYQENVADLGNPDPPIPLNQIFDFVKNKTIKVKNVHDQLINNGSLSGSSQSESTDRVLDDSTGNNAKTIAMDKSLIFDKMKEKNELDALPAQVTLARELCQRGKVTLVSQRNAFVVENMEGRKYCVTLFPKETCQFPSESTCYHIIATRLAIEVVTMSPAQTQPIVPVLSLSSPITDPVELHQSPTEAGLKAKKQEEDECEQKKMKSLDSIVIGQSLDSSRSGVDETITAAIQSVSSHERKRRKKVELYGNIDQEAVENTSNGCLNKKQRTGRLAQTSIAQNGMEKLQNRSPLMQRENGLRENMGSTTAGEVEASNERLHCICRQPYDESKDMAECVRCSEWFHRHSIDIPSHIFRPSGSSQYWECNQCWKVGVMKWGGELRDDESGQHVKLVNTCPVDSVLTILHSYEKFDSLFVGQLSSRKPAEAALGKCLLSMREGEYVMAKWMWISYLESASCQLNIKAKDGYIWYDLYAGIDDMIFQFFTDVWTVQFTITCSNRACTRRIWKHKSSHFTLRSEHRDGSSYDVVRALTSVVFNANNCCMAM